MSVASKFSLYFPELSERFLYTSHSLINIQSTDPIYCTLGYLINAIKETKPVYLTNVIGRILFTLINGTAVHS